MKTPALTPEESAELDRISHNFAASWASWTTTSTKVAKAFLLQGPYFCCGQMREGVVKRKGPGVVELRSKEYNP